MRIVIDMQGAQSASRFRGIGRYSMALAQALVRQKGQHDVFLALNGAFADTLQPIRKAFANLPENRICVWHAPLAADQSGLSSKARKTLGAQLRADFLDSLEPDVIFVTSLFEGFSDEACVTLTQTHSRSLVAVTVYDLIPLLNPRQYLDVYPSYADYYRRQVEQLQQADLFLAISEFSRAEAIEHLAVSADRVVNISAACDTSFTPIELSRTAATACLKSLGIHRPFIFYTGGADDRKNLPRLIQAYAALPDQVRARYQLVFAGKMDDGEVQQLTVLAASHALSPDDLCLTGFITDQELVKAYNLCSLFVFPSWHEGFGLPPLEAMSCGAPVIASQTSSLPEVMGWDAAMFDPLDVSSIASKMLQALTDDTFRSQLIEHGKRQSRLFSWDHSARKTIASMEEAYQQRFAKTADERVAQPSTRARIRQQLNALASTLTGLGQIPDDELTRISACVAANQQQAVAALLPAKLAWRTEGPFDSSYSLALVNREFALALHRLGHDVALHATEGPGDFDPNPVFLANNPQIASLHARAQSMDNDGADILSRFTYPPRVSDMTSRLNALQCYGWEESQFPDPWVDDFNEHLQCLTVMSAHVAKVMVDNGLRVPVINIGLGVDHWDRIQAEPDFSIQAKSFRFLHVSSCFPRKGADVLLKAYGQAFRREDDVTLIIKTFPNPHNDIHSWLQQARAGDADYPDVLILEEDYPDERLKALYEQCHVLVAPSRAEGFGLPLAEAMLSGLAVVTTGWSGQLDFCKPQTAWLVDYSFAKAQTHFELFDSVWAEPSLAGLTQALRDVYQVSGHERAERAAAGRQLLEQQFRWTHVAQRAEAALRQLGARFVWPAPRIGWVSTWNSRCGIAGFSGYLLRHMPPDILVLANRTTDRTAADDQCVSRCWDADGIDTLDQLSAAIQAAQLETVVVQFNFGFFNFRHLAAFLHAQNDSGRMVVVEMHATIDPPGFSDKRLQDLVPALARCVRVLVHTVEDLNRLKLLGLVDNVTLLPLGLPDYTPAAIQPSKGNDFVLASYGFFLPHKGFAELIEAVSLMRHNGHRVALKMYNARYPAPQSDQAIAQAREKVSNSGAQDFIQIMTDYLDDKTSLDLLAQADLIVYPYQVTGESASAAVRHGIASGRPVAVTPLGIFNDVKPAVHELPGISPSQMADGLCSLIKLLQAHDPQMAEKAAVMSRWREAHRYSLLAKRLYNMLIGLSRQPNPPSSVF